MECDVIKGGHTVHPEGGIPQT